MFFRRNWIGTILCWAQQTFSMEEYIVQLWVLFIFGYLQQTIWEMSRVVRIYVGARRCLLRSAINQSILVKFESEVSCTCWSKDHNAWYFCLLRNMGQRWTIRGSQNPQWTDGRDAIDAQHTETKGQSGGSFLHRSCGHHKEAQTMSSKRNDGNRKSDVMLGNNLSWNLLTINRHSFPI